MKKSNLRQMYTISSQAFSLPILNSLINDELKIELSDEVRQSIIRCRNYLDKKIATTLDPIYGINTSLTYIIPLQLQN